MLKSDDLQFSVTSKDGKVTDEQKFLRYYYILRTIKRNHAEFPHVFNDLYNLYDTGLSSPLFRNTMERIIAYANGELDEFLEILEENG